jgi:hypothetical protein
MSVYQYMLGSFSSLSKYSKFKLSNLDLHLNLRSNSKMGVGVFLLGNILIFNGIEKNTGYFF